jgi:hypothetical protein
MVRSGTIKTLAALIAAMTLGTWALIWMETAPARPNVPLPLQAANSTAANPYLLLVRQTEVPLQYIKWQNIVIHDAGRDGSQVARGCHFIVGSEDRLGDGVVRPTGLWLRQDDGKHITVPGFSYNLNSIGICVLFDGSSGAPTPKQSAALVGLVQALQATCQVPADHVYLHGELSQVDCPGPFFPTETFRQRLLPSTR